MAKSSTRMTMSEDSNMATENLEAGTSAAMAAAAEPEDEPAEAAHARDDGDDGDGDRRDAGPQAARPQADDEDEDDDEEIDPEDFEVTRKMVTTADLTTDKGRALVARYYQQQLAGLNRSIGFCVVEGKGVIVRVGRNAIGELGIQFINIDAERVRLANRELPYVAGKQEDPELRWKPIFPEWLKWHGRRTYDGVTFKPKREVMAAKHLPPVAAGGLGALDLFVGTAWEAEPGNCDLILQHIREVWCGGEEEATEYTLSWLARMVQQPGRAAETVLVLRSGQGIGKGTVTGIFRSYFGVHGIEITSDRELTGFNDRLATSVFISLNEATWGGNRAGEGALKAIITDPTLTVERKYLPVFTIANTTHLIVSSNSDWAVPVGHDDRRYAILNPSDGRKGDTAYFAALHAQIKGGGDRALIHWLLQRDISGFNPRVLPKVKGDIKLEQKMRSANSVAQWLHGLLAAGGVDVMETSQWGSSKNHVFVDLTQAPIRTQALYEDYRRAAHAVRPEPVELWAKTVRKILGASVVVSRHRSSYRPTPQSAANGPVPCYSMPDLAQARDAFAEYMGEDITWT